MPDLDTTTTPDRLDRILTFLQAAQGLKDTARSARTAAGQPESVAEHSWSLCLLVLLMERDLPPLDLAKLLKLCVIHDLGEVISGDIPAIHQVPGTDKAAAERADFVTLIAPLPDDLRAEFLALWDEYEAARSAEAQAAKGLDKIETMLQHVSGQQEPGFDYLWNLGYGRDRTDALPVLRALRDKVDVLTRAADASR